MNYANLFLNMFQTHWNRATWRSDLEEAERLYLEVIEGYTDALGANHASTLRTKGGGAYRRPTVSAASGGASNIPGAPTGGACRRPTVIAARGTT